MYSFIFYWFFSYLFYYFYFYIAKLSYNLLMYDFRLANSFVKLKLSSVINFSSITSRPTLSEIAVFYWQQRFNRPFNASNTTNSTYANLVHSPIDAEGKLLLSVKHYMVSISRQSFKLLANSPQFKHFLRTYKLFCIFIILLRDERVFVILVRASSAVIFSPYSTSFFTRFVGSLIGYVIGCLVCSFFPIALSKSFSEAVRDSSNPINLLQSLWQCFSAMSNIINIIRMCLQPEKQIQLLREYARALQSENKTRIQQKELLQDKKFALQKQNENLKLQMSSVLGDKDANLKMMKQIKEYQDTLKQQSQICQRIRLENKDLGYKLSNLQNQVILLEHMVSSVQKQKYAIKSIPSSNLQNISQNYQSNHSILSHTLSDPQKTKIRNQIREQIKERKEKEKALVRTEYEKHINQKQIQIMKLNEDIEECAGVEHGCKDGPDTINLRLNVLSLKSQLQISLRVINQLRNQIRQLDFVNASQHLQIIKKQSLVYQISKNKLVLAEKSKIENQSKKIIQDLKKHTSQLQQKLRMLQQQQIIRPNNIRQSIAPNEGCIQNKFVTEQQKQMDRQISMEQNKLLRDIAFQLTRNNSEMIALISNFNRDKVQENIVDEIESAEMNEQDAVIQNLKQEIMEMKKQIKYKNGLYSQTMETREQKVRNFELPRVNDNQQSFEKYGADKLSWKGRTKLGLDLESKINKLRKENRKLAQNLNEGSI